MIEIEKRGGISSFQKERSQIQSSPQYKAWTEMNDLVGEINEKTSELRNERDKVIMEIQKIDANIDRMSSLKKTQLEAIVDLGGAYLYAGFFDKMSIKANRNKVEANIDRIDQMIHAQQQERRSLYQQVEEYKSILSQLSDQCDQVIEQRDQFDDYYEKSRKLSNIIKGYNNSISLYNEYLNAKKKMNHDSSEMNKLISNIQEKVDQCFSLNIIPIPYRNLECMYWLNNYVSSSQPTELHQVFALMSLQKIREEMQTTNNYLARIANGQEKQITLLNDIKKNLVAHRQEQKKAEQKYLEAFEKARETISDGIMTIGNEMENILDQLDENGRIAQNQIDELKNCNNMLSSIQLQETFYHESTINTLANMSWDITYRS